MKVTANIISKVIIFLFPLFGGIFYYSCSNSNLSDEEIYKRAIKITEILNENDVDIDIFREWNFGLRGQGEIWSKTLNDTTLYSCFYQKIQDTIAITVSTRFIYSAEFPCSFGIDTSKFWNITFKMYNNENIKIEGIGKDGQDHLIIENINIKDVFTQTNPFSKLDSLILLKEKLGVCGISYMPRIGDFIQFYITYQDVLTYIPNFSTFKQTSKEIWIKEFAKGREIKDKWNLRRLDRPLEN